MKYNVVLIHKPDGHKFEKESILIDRVPLDTAKALLDKITIIIRETGAGYFLSDDTLACNNVTIKIKECVPFTLGQELTK